MRIIKYLLKWCAILCLGLIATAAIILPGLAIYVRADAPVLTQVVTSALVIVSACIFLIICLLEYKP